MEKIPTAEELIRSQFCKGEFEEIMECLNTSIEPSIVRAMIEFAKIHVEAALKEASENAKIQIGDNCILNKIAIHPNSLIDTAVITTNAASILNSYPLSNIK